MEAPPPASAGDATVTIDFPKTKAELVVVLDKATGGRRSGSLDAQREAIRQAAASLPGSAWRDDAGKKKLELVAEAKAVLELAFRSLLDARIV